VAKQYIPPGKLEILRAIENSGSNPNNYYAVAPFTPRHQPKLSANPMPVITYSMPYLNCWVM